MAKPKALAGTAAAARPCLCGHTKIRHGNAGKGRCAGLNASAVPNYHRPAHSALTSCACTAFTPDRQD